MLLIGTSRLNGGDINETNSFAVLHNRALGSHRWGSARIGIDHDDAYGRGFYKNIPGQVQQ